MKHGCGTEMERVVVTVEGVELNAARCPNHPDDEYVTLNEWARFDRAIQSRSNVSHASTVRTV